MSDESEVQDHQDPALSGSIEDTTSGLKELKLTQPKINNDLNNDNEEESDELDKTENNTYNETNDNSNDADNDNDNNTTEVQVEEEDDDDDFGSFSDASFDDFEQPQQPPQTQSQKEQEQASNTTSSSSTLRFPQSTFKDKDELLSKLTELTNKTFPTTLPNYSIPSNSNILNERSEHLLERLIAPPYLKPYNWQRSSLRKKLLQTLGLPDDDILVKHERVNTFDVDGYEVKTLEVLGITDVERKELLEKTDSLVDEILGDLESPETLSVLDSNSLGLVIEKLEREVETVEKLLSCWDNERKKLEEDHETFEGVVENLVGHTQRLRREEIMKSMRKEKEKSNRLSIFKKKSKK